METLKLLKAKVGHERTKSAHNRFQYEVFYVDVPVTKNPVALPSFFSFDRFNVFSMYMKDHGAGDMTPWHTWFTARCHDAGITIRQDDTVRLISHPRVFGYAFNPISFWLLQDAKSNLRAVLCEVHNTFGDDHNYLLSHPTDTPMLSGEIFRADKKLYVSPFNTMRGHYLFSFSVSDQKFAAHIKYFVADELVLDTYMGGVTAPLTPLAILRSVFAYPFMTLLVVFRIHYQALKLRLKGVLFTLDQRPAHTSKETSTGSDDLRK